MLALRRSGGAARVARSAQFSSSARAHGGDHGHGHSAPKQDEKLGLQYYLVIGSLPAMWVLYKISQSNTDDEKKPALSRLIDSYSYLQEQFKQRNKVHTAMVEQAAFDRNLFQSDRKTQHVPLRFPEVFNTGAPYNVSAGQGSRGIEELVAHYEKINNDAEANKLEKLRAKAELA